MDKFIKCLVIVILENIINKVIIVNKGKYQIIKSLPNRKNSLDVRFKSKTHESIHKQLNPFQNIKSLNEVKLKQDIYFITTILTRTIYNILKFNSLLWITNIVKDNKLRFFDEESFLFNYEINKGNLKDLKETFPIRITSGEKHLYSYDEILINLKNDLNNIRRVYSIERSLIGIWGKSRVDQALYLIKIEAGKRIKIIESYEHKISDEQKAVQDVKIFYRMQIEEYKNLVNYWAKRYTCEWSELQDKITITLKKINEIEKKNEKHYEIYVKRQEFIDEYLKKKAEELKDYEFEEKRISSAIKIQAFWRGVMVRKYLGPYKKKKKGKKSKKK